MRWLYHMRKMRQKFKKRMAQPCGDSLLLNTYNRTLTLNRGVHWMHASALGWEHTSCIWKLAQAILYLYTLQRKGYWKRDAWLCAQEFTQHWSKLYDKKKKNTLESGSHGLPGNDWLIITRKSLTMAPSCRRFRHRWTHIQNRHWQRWMDGCRLNHTPLVRYGFMKDYWEKMCSITRHRLRRVPRVHTWWERQRCPLRVSN